MDNNEIVNINKLKSLLNAEKYTIEYNKKNNINGPTKPFLGEFLKNPNRTNLFTTGNGDFQTNVKEKVELLDLSNIKNEVLAAILITMFNLKKFKENGGDLNVPLPVSHNFENIDTGPVNINEDNNFEKLLLDNLSSVEKAFNSILFREPINKKKYIYFNESDYISGYLNVFLKFIDLEIVGNDRLENPRMWNDIRIYNLEQRKCLNKLNKNNLLLKITKIRKPKNKVEENTGRKIKR